MGTAEKQQIWSNSMSHKMNKTERAAVNADACIMQFMLRSILLALDTTPGSKTARAVAAGLMQSYAAKLTGAALVDRSELSELGGDIAPRGGTLRSEIRIAGMIDALQAEIPKAEVRELDDAPEAALLRKLERHDLLVIGRDSALDGEPIRNGVSPLIEGLVRHGARPVIVVPYGAPLVGPVVVAYDGSAACQRSLQICLLLGLLSGRDVTIASVADIEERGQECAERCSALLHRHGIAVRAVGLAGAEPVDSLIERAQSLKASLLVIGAYGHSLLRDMFVGSTTRALLRRAPCSVFMYH
jgi:nucleotide-binding universal stress UspA family protein